MNINKFVTLLLIFTAAINNFAMETETEKVFRQLGFEIINTENIFDEEALTSCHILIDPRVFQSASDAATQVRNMLLEISPKAAIINEKISQHHAVQKVLLQELSENKELKIVERAIKRREISEAYNTRLKELTDEHKALYSYVNQIPLGSLKDTQNAEAFIAEIQQGLAQNMPADPDEGLYGAKFYYNDQHLEGKREIAVVKSKIDASRGKNRLSITAEQTISNEALAYMFDKYALPRPYGVPETYLVEMPLQIGQEACLASVQRFVPRAKNLLKLRTSSKTSNLSAISSVAFEVLNYHFLTGNIDGNLENILWDEKSLFLIDNGFAFPGTTDQVNYRCDWTIFPQAHEKMSREEYDRLLAINIQHAMNVFENWALNNERMNSAFKFSPDKYITQMFRLELAKIVAKNKLSQYQWFRIMSNRNPETLQDIGIGGELISIYDKYLQNSDPNETDWRKIATQINWNGVREEMDVAAKMRLLDSK